MEESVPPPVVPVALESKPKRNWLKIFLGVFLGIVFIFLFAAAFRPEAATFATISGSIRYNGLRPVGSLKGKIVIVQKELNTQGDYQLAVDNVPVTRGAPWSWNQALEGRTYQLQAYLEVDGQKLAYSNILNTTAPAVDQELILNVTRNTLVQFNVPPSELVTYSNATISGVLDLNGYIPEGSTVRILGKKDSDLEYSLSSEVMPAQDGKTLSWESAQAGEMYDFVGLMSDVNGNEIGRSSVEQIVAPSGNNTLTIQSSAYPPTETQKGVISGKIQLNGAAQMGSKISMRQKLPNDNEFQEFTELDPVNGVEWSWGDALVGQVYDITAVMEVNGVDSSYGEVLSVTAPASSEEITLDTKYSPTPTISPTPSSSPTTTGTPMPEPTRTPLPSITPIPTAIPSVTPIPTASPTPTASPSTSACSVKYSITSETSDSYTSEVTIRNNTANAINGWTMTWKFKGNQTIMDMWNATFTQSGNTPTITNSESTAQIAASGGTVTFGFSASYKGANNSPDNYTLNGAGCDTY